MAPKRVSKSKTVKVLDYNALVLKDVLCPICRSILIEPVTLPCNHGFCSSCFDSTMQNANLVCPLCRIRIGSWLRRAKKEAKLINYEMWDAIKNKFPQQIKNKMNGVDENLEEETEVIVSYPGEIRKEYEIQKQRDNDEFRKKCEADMKASEDLIRKICEEEDYERAVMEKKLKLDEQVAKKLAEELALTNPSTSKVKQTKRLGPMDKFVKQENDITLQNADKESVQLNNFATKEYTCRVLRLDYNNTGKEPYKKLFSPIIPKKIQQMQRIADTDVTSDSSDCIESELRYFKPIDYRGNPPSEKKPAIRVPTRKPHQNMPARILSPTGLINFHSNILESAFARISFSKSADARKKTDMSRGSNNSTIVTSNSKRTHSNDETQSPKIKIKRKDSTEKIEEESPTLNNFSRTSRKKRYILGKSNNTVKQHSSSPFLGFEKISDSNSNITNNKTSIIKIVEEEKSKKRLQEMADLEFAKKLQDELNRGAHYTRSSRRRVGSKRQATLDEIIKTPYRVK